MPVPAPPPPQPADLPPVDEASFRRAVGHFATGVTVATTRVGTLRPRDDGERLHLGLAGAGAGAGLRRQGSAVPRRGARVRHLGGVRPVDVGPPGRRLVRHQGPPAGRASSTATRTTAGSPAPRCSTARWPGSSAAPRPCTTAATTTSSWAPSWPRPRATATPPRCSTTAAATARPPDRRGTTVHRRGRRLLSRAAGDPRRWACVVGVLAVVWLGAVRRRRLRRRARAPRSSASRSAARAPSRRRRPCSASSRTRRGAAIPVQASDGAPPPCSRRRAGLSLDVDATVAAARARSWNPLHLVSAAGRRRGGRAGRGRRPGRPALGRRPAGRARSTGPRSRARCGSTRPAWPKPVQPVDGLRLARRGSVDALAEAYLVGGYLRRRAGRAAGRRSTSPEVSRAEVAPGRRGGRRARRPPTT